MRTTSTTPTTTSPTSSKKLAIALLAAVLGPAAGAGVITKDQLPYKFGDGYQLIDTVGAKSAESFDLYHPVKNMGPNYQAIGEMSTEYQLYKGTYGKPADGATDGTAGVWADYVKSLPKNVGLNTNWSFAFLQAVSADTDPGVQPWGAKKGEWFMDTGDVTNDPRYGGLDGDKDEFSDYPNRALKTNETWKAEMSLALIDMADKKVEFVGAFIWGFRINAGAITTDGTNYGAPLAWGPVDDNLLGAFKKDWKKPDGTDIPDFHDWTVVDVTKGGPEGLILTPAPSAASLALAVAGALVARRRRKVTA